MGLAFPNQSARHRELRARRGVRSRSYPGEDGRPPHTRWGFGLVRHFLRMSWPLKGWLPSLSKAWIRIIFCTIFLRAISACCGRPAGNWRPPGCVEVLNITKVDMPNKTEDRKLARRRGDPDGASPGAEFSGRSPDHALQSGLGFGAAGRRPYSIWYQYLIRWPSGSES